MNAKIETAESQFDLVKWIVVVLLVAGGIVGNSVYADFSLAYRVPALLVIVLVAGFVAVKTAKGAAFWNLLQESLVEIRKVVWPTTQETNQTTLIVAIVVLIMAVILWGLDSFLGWIASLILG
ncbi:preprotein translocase subunit SecE [Aurantivibrio infirmus]